ncbi:MAG: hypothetical protein E3J63_00995 [Elusimicrobia bacterium]|nr:MAG: hypothetical protein E3J63_00995 [Elusimicrobiota bacterium]
MPEKKDEKEKDEKEKKPEEKVVHDLMPVQKLVPMFADLTPKATLEVVREMAAALMEVITSSKKKLIVPITDKGGRTRDFMIYEGWEFLAAVSNMVVSTDDPIALTDKDGHPNGYRCKARVRDGRTGKEISHASAIITRNERGMSVVPAFQLYSKVQTRAGSKALRMVLSHIVVLAGVEPTPAEEMQDSNVYEKGEVVVGRGETLEPKDPELSLEE